MTPALSGQKVLVFGLAKSGLAAIKLLLAQGARVTALDAREEGALGDVARELKAQGVTLVTGRTPAGLRSEWTMPRPAVMRFTAPASIVAKVPSESRWSIAPANR